GDRRDIEVQYHFGSEAMVAQGGWPYTSARSYVVSSAVGGVVSLIVAGVLLYAGARRARGWALVGYLALCLALVYVCTPRSLSLSWVLSKSHGWAGCAI